MAAAMNSAAERAGHAGIVPRRSGADCSIAVSASWLVDVTGQSADADRADPSAVLEDGDAAEEEREERVKLASSAGSARAFSASSRVDVASLRAAVYALR
jgi:hypothetical protein